MINELFDLNYCNNPEIKERCKMCLHFSVKEYRNGKRFFYCLDQADNKTDTGFRKIKANNKACKFYKEKER